MDQQCAYCERKNESGITLLFGSKSDDPGEWVLWEGTGKSSCPDPECNAKGERDSKRTIENHTKLFSIKMIPPSGREEAVPANLPSFTALTNGLSWGKTSVGSEISTRAPARTSSFQMLRFPSSM